MTVRSQKPANGPLKAVGYARVSTAEQGQHGVSLAAQRERIEAFCKSRGWLLVRVYTDVASGKDLKRSGLQRLLEDSKRGEFEVTVITKVDRLTRRVMDFGLLQEALQRQGIGLASIGEGFDDTTPIGRAMSNIIATFAQLERELIGERTRDALRHKKEHLQAYNRQTPYGFRRKDDSLLPDPDTLKVVKEIFAQRKAGASLRDIAQGLTGRGIPSPQGRPEWSAETVRLILRNAALYGQVLNGLLQTTRGARR